MTKRLEYDTEDAAFKDIDGSFEDISDVQKTVDQELDEVLAEIGADKDDVKLKMGVYRVMPNSGELEWCFYFTPAELPILDRLRDEYNGGVFQVRVYKNGRITTRKTINVAKPNKDRPVQQSGSDIEAILKYVNTGMSQLSESIRQLQTTPQQPQIDPMASMGQMMALMLQMKELTAMDAPPPQRNGMEFKDMMELVRMGTEMGGNGPDPLVKALETFGPVVSKAMTMESTKPKPRPTQQTNFQPNPSPPPPSTKQDGNNMFELKKRIITGKLKELVDVARSGKDPELYGELVMDQVDEEILRGLVCADDAKEQLCQFVPEINDNWEWFENMRGYIKSALDDTDEPLTDNVDSSNIVNSGDNNKAES